MKYEFILLCITTLEVLALILLGARCIPKQSYAVNGTLFGYSITTSVDSELARKMLAKPNDVSVQNLMADYKNQKLNTETLSEISEKYSADVATLYFIHRAYQNKINTQHQDEYLKLYNQQMRNESIDLTGLKDFYVAFVPGLAYKEDTTTGADFAHQRRLLSSSGVSNELIETGEWDLSDSNAEKIADKLKELVQSYSKIIVVSGSKGGLETAIALGKILTPEESKNIHAWVSVGGILRGSPIADSYLKAPKRGFAVIMLWFKGKKIDLIRDLSYTKRKKDFEQLTFPDHLKIIHYVGAPLATKISKEIKRRYCTLKKYGPNDGLTPIADEVTEKGIIISELGLDHYYRDQNIDKKTLSLAILATRD